MREKILMFLLGLLLMASNAAAQVTSVSGTVTSTEDGEPVVGASVIVKGTKTGTVTNLDGEFQLSSIPKGAKTLVISSLGMDAREVPIKSVVKVSLSPSSQALGEVMVVAFGKQKREAFTGSAGVIKSDDIAARQVSSPLDAISGKVAGVQMVESNDPAGDPTILVRGVSSINAGTSPLIILDGLPYPGYYSDINPADVESVTVLKDAASTALYGARGANGVIMITTKAASRGKAVITVNAKWGANSNARVDYNTIDNPAQYYEAYYAARYNYFRNSGMDAYAAYVQANNTLGASVDAGGLGYIGYSVPDGQYLIGTNGKLNPQATLGNRFSYNGQDYTIQPDDWKKEGTRTGLRQEYSVNLTGGSDQFQALASLGYLRNEGLSYGSDYKRYTARAKMDYQARPWLRVGANMSYAHNETDNETEIFSYYPIIAPIYPVYVRDGNGNIMTDSNGRVYDYGDGTVWGLTRPFSPSYSPIQTDRLDLYNNNSNAFGLQGYADISFLKDFKLTVNGSVYDTENRFQSANNPFYGYVGQIGGYVSSYHYRTYSLNSQQLLNWNKTFGKHTISAMIGHEYTRESNYTTGASRSGIIDFQNNKELEGAITEAGNEGYSSVYNIEGYMFRVNYDYDSKYFGSASFRRDGSSRFDPDHRWGNFWSLGGAWIISKEAWYDIPWMNMLKFKASYGQQGNDEIGDYRYTNFYDIVNNNGLGAVSFYSKGNKDITWETNSNFNTGFEFELFKSRLRGGIEYYYRKTSDMLLWFTSPLSIGYSGYYDNVGDLVNKGVELTLEGDVIRTKNVTWSLNLNLSHNHNEVTSLPAENKTASIEGHDGFISSDGYRIYAEGLPIYAWYLKRYAGVSSDGQSQWYYKDADGNLQTTTNYDTGDYFLCDDPNPDVYGGFGTSLRAYGFDFAASFIYSIGGKCYDGGYQTLMTVPYAGNIGYALHQDILDAWSTDNPTSNIPRLQYNDTYAAAASDRFLKDASSLTFKTLTLGYTFPARLVQRIGLSSLRVFATCDNVAYWTHRRGFDPRTTLSGSAVYTGYPPMRTISGGITVKF